MPNPYERDEGGNVPDEAPMDSEIVDHLRTKGVRIPELLEGDVRGRETRGTLTITVRGISLEAARLIHQHLRYIPSDSLPAGSFHGASRPESLWQADHASTPVRI